MDINQILQMPESQRDDLWERRFLDAAPGIKVEVLGGGEPVQGPDGWPYLQVRTGSGDEPLLQIIRWLAGRGIGLVVNPHKMTPDYVFTYGMLWNFVESGRFIVPSMDLGSEFSLIERPILGPPADAYLPPYVRALMVEFLAAQGIQGARVLVATTADYTQTDLVFSLESLGHPEGEDQKSIAGALSWFLPLHYPVVFASESQLSGWVPL